MVVTRTLNYAGDNQYRVYTLPYQTDIPESYSKPLAFDLSANPLPLHITDVTLQLVYRGRLGSEDGAVGVGAVALGSIGTEIDISLPAAGIYAKTTPDNVFTGIALTASARVPGLNLADGLIELEVRYRWATSDPFASVPVDTEPQNAVSRIIRVPEKYGVKTLTQSTPVSLQFDLPAGQLPWYATDVYLNLIYRRAGDPETKTLAVGYHDISEPTPVDLFSNTDKVCVNGTWYDAGSPGAVAAVDDIGNRNGIADESDIYPHFFTNILGEISSVSDPAPASATRYDLFEPGPMPPDTLLRLGYILTDYSFTYSFLATWNTMSTDDHWPTGSPASLFPGTAVKNQTDADGSYSYPGMYTIRGYKMWWGTGLIYDNPFYPTNSSCDWGVLQ